MAEFTINCRYKRLSDFNSKVLICRDNDIEGKDFKILKDIYKKLQELKLDTYLPVYSNGTTSSITVDDRNGIIKNPKIHNVYKLTFRLGRVERDNKSYINVILDRAKLVKKGDDVSDSCEILDL